MGILHHLPIGSHSHSGTFFIGSNAPYSNGNGGGKYGRSQENRGGHSFSCFTDKANKVEILSIDKAVYGRDMIVHNNVKEA